jgi:hypothetical protein
MLVTNRDNVVNGLHIYPHGPVGLEPYITAPSARQLNLLEQAINACTYDWDRLQAIGLGAAALQLYWVNPDYLYAGHIGIVSLPSGSITLPTGNHMPPAFAPLTAPYDGLGDYGGFLANDAGGPSVYLLNTLDQDPPPYGGLRFYMETVVRLLGLAATYLCLKDSASQRDRLARCFVPADRPDFDIPVQTWDQDYYGDPSGDPGRFLWASSDTPGAQEVYDYHQPYLGPAIPGRFGPPGGDPQYWPEYIVYAVIGYGMHYKVEVDLRMYATSQWFFESSGVESRMYPLPPQTALPQSGLGHGGPPAGDYEDTWGFMPSPVPAPRVWETRLLEAAGETFKDIFLDKQYRRVTNRTAVKLKPGRVAWGSFVALFMDEIPAPPDASGIYNYGAKASSDYVRHPITNPNPPPDQILVLDGGRMDETLGFFTIPQALGDDTTPVTVEITPAHAGQHGNNFKWSIDISWVGPRPPAYEIEQQHLDALLPMLVRIPKSDFADTSLVIGVHGVTRGLPASGLAGVSQVAAARAMEQNTQDALFGTNAGQVGISQAPVYQWFKYRVTLPTKPHPRYPGGEITATGFDSGVRRNGRQLVGNDAAAEDPGPVVVRTRKASPAKSIWRPTQGDHGTVKT